ncbi:HDOD domain-containing protein [Undibacterium sp. FT147W]|uniref:HDOD domain-containing protein n=1 Tax=Undibacterium rivi TaxID=2828729 RepID=A0ABS5H4N8_9BURK|nr:HDOD domain-containing protein [Undibacterium rivi]MBR7793517.1 HDOD domain-containing protein [Undibacterium rivi]
MKTDVEKNALLQDMIKHMKDLPMLPAVARELVSVLEDENSSLDLINEKIAMDHAITAKVLRLVNSSHFGVNSRVVTIQQATALLGVEKIKNLVRLTILANRSSASYCEGFNFQAFWRHSVATAICAELISRALHMKHDFAFTAGLLHDIGRLVLVTYYPEKYAEVIKHRQLKDCYLLDAEREIMGIDHVDAGLTLAQQWFFAEAIQDAIRGHHCPDIAGIHPLASVVHVADAVVHALDLADEKNDVVPLLSAHAWDTLALSETEYLGIFRETEMRVEALNQILI